MNTVWEFLGSSGKRAVREDLLILSNVLFPMSVYYRLCLFNIFVFLSFSWLFLFQVSSNFGVDNFIWLCCEVLVHSRIAPHKQQPVLPPSMRQSCTGAPRSILVVPSTGYPVGGP